MAGKPETVRAVAAHCIQQCASPQQSVELHTPVVHNVPLALGNLPVPHANEEHTWWREDGKQGRRLLWSGLQPFLQQAPSQLVCLHLEECWTQEPAGLRRRKARIRMRGECLRERWRTPGMLPITSTADAPDPFVTT
jgi:hypothetical protein